MHVQVFHVVSMVSYQASGDPYVISRRNLLSATQQRLMGTSKCGGEQLQLRMVFPRKPVHKSQKDQAPTRKTLTLGWVS